MRPFHQTKNKEFTPYNGDTKKLIENIGRKFTIPQNRHPLQATSPKDNCDIKKRGCPTSQPNSLSSFILQGFLPR